VAFVGLQAQRFQEAVGRFLVPQQTLVQAPEQRVEECGAPPDETGLGQRRPRVQIGPRLLHAVRRRTKAVPDGQARVPEKLQRALDEGGDGRRGAAGVQEKQVHVRIGSELGPAVAPQGHHRTTRELGLRRRTRRLGRGPAGPCDDEVYLVAARVGDLGSAEPEPVPHPKPRGLETDVAAQSLEELGGASLIEESRRIRVDRGGNVPVFARHHDAVMISKGRSRIEALDGDQLSLYLMAT
jgi:hypothetical protein